MGRRARQPRHLFHWRSIWARLFSSTGATKGWWWAAYRAGASTILFPGTKSQFCGADRYVADPRATLAATGGEFEEGHIRRSHPGGRSVSFLILEWRLSCWNPTLSNRPRLPAFAPTRHARSRIDGAVIGSMAKAKKPQAQAAQSPKGKAFSIHWSDSSTKRRR